MQNVQDDRRVTKPTLPWNVRLQLSAIGAAVDATQRRNGTVNRFLFSFVDRQAPADPRPDAGGVRSLNITVDASTGVWARVFAPSAEAESLPSPRPVIVYFHGGGFTVFSAATRPYDAFCRTLCRETGAVVVSVSYRLAPDPEHRCPAAYDDGVDVLRYLSTNNGLPADIGIPVDLSRCFLASDSAGGNIVHHVAQRWVASPPPSSPVRLAGVILLQPYFGGEERTEAEVRLDGVAPVLNMRRSDRNHPAAHVTGEAGPEPELPEGFPPAMVVIGGFDPLQDWQRRYAGMLRREGKAVQLLEFPEAIHGFYAFRELPDAGKLVKEFKAFIERNT